MSESASHNIVIGVDCSRGIASLRDLQRQVQSTAQEFRSLGGGTGFDALKQQVATTSGAFSQLARQLSAVSAAARSIGNLSGGGFNNLARDASNARVHIHALGGSFSITSQAAALFGATVGGLSLERFSSGVQNAGNNLLSFRIAIDSIATSSRESGDALKFIRDTATNIGAPLDTATESFKMLYSSMRALGRSPDEIMKVFRGFSTALSALHVSAADQRMAWREIAETYSQGVIHTRQAILSLGSHIPAMSANLQQALGVSGEKLHSMFKAGGLPLDTWTKVSELLEKRYSGGLAEAANHSTLNIIALQNALTQLHQTVYENGFDSGLTTFLKTLQSSLNSIGIDDFGARIGEAFRTGFTALSLLTQKAFEAREPIMAVGKVIAGYAIAATGIRIASGALALLLSPLGAATALAALMSSQWQSLTNTFSGGDAQFNSGAERLKHLTGGLIDMHRAALGAVEAWTLLKNVVAGKSWEDSKHAAAVAGGQFLRGEFGKEGDDAGKAFADRFNGIVGAMKLPSFGNLSKEFDELYRQSAPRPFMSHGDYDSNTRQYSKVNNELTESLKKVFERLSHANKGLLEYRENLEAIAKMAGKLNPVTGKLIDDSQLSRLRDVAREKALSESFPAVNKIQSLMDSIKLEQEALRNVGGNTAGEQIKIEREFLTFKQSMLKQHIELTREEENAVRALLTTRNQLERGGENGFARWANQQKSEMEGINDSIGHGLDTVADGLAKIATSGKNIKESFRDMLRSIAADFIRQGIRTMMADALKQANVGALFGDNGLGANIKAALGLGQGVIDKANKQLDDVAKSLSSTVTGTMDVQAAVVNINGGIGGASGIDAFKPGSFIENAIRPQAVSGVLPRNDNGAALFSGNALQEFKSNVRTGGLGSIPSNSAQLFGAGITGRQGLGDVGGALKAIPDFKLSSAESVAAFGKGLQKLAPVAQQAGLTPISGSLAEMYKHSGLNASTIANLKTVHPDLQKVILRVKELSGAQFTMNNGQGLRTQAQANANAARHLGIRNSQHLEGTAADVNLYRNGRYISDGGDPAYRSFNDSVQRAAKEYGLPIKWGGDFNDPDHWQLPRGWRGASNSGFSKQSGLGDINKLGDESKKVADSLRKQTQETSRLFTESQKSMTALAPTSQSLSQFDDGVTNLADTMMQGIPPTESFGSEISKLIEKMLSGLGGGGGDGLFGGVGGIVAGLFADGGAVESPSRTGVFPASLWHGARAFADGGGIPSILHPGEVVLNAAQQRNVAAGLQGGDTTTNTANTVHIHVDARDADSFRKTKSQIAAAFHREVGRMAARNG